MFLFCCNAFVQGQVTINNNNTSEIEIPVKLKTAIKIETFIDTRDGRSYKYAKIGNQIWMLENLSFDYVGSLCYGDSNINCEKYGRLYTFEMANACPEGWRLPTVKECSILFEFSGGVNIAGKVLKANKLWNKSEITGLLDVLNFSAYPGGIFTGKNSSKTGGMDNKYNGLGDAGYFWTSDASTNNNFGYYFQFFYNQNFVYQSGIDRDSYLSVRCMKPQ